MDARYVSEQSDILDRRFCDLKLSLRGSWVQACVQQLYRELRSKKLLIRPHVWMATEWFSPDGVPGIALPFYLFDSELAELEANAVGEAEGVDRDWCMQLLRHECGHAIDNAFGLRRLKQRQRLFGLTGKQYPKSYVPNRSSKDYVLHLDDHYAQAHPDEDWAETFAVWLDPQSNWRQRYADWPALTKLLYVDKVMRSLAGKRPAINSIEQPGNIKHMRQTLRRHYSIKLRDYQKIRNLNKADASQLVLM